ncbi:unnamed protein product [Acanthoscelides obtectus]|uniref:Uncharacterized protein n=1 Tax=Acanthoscelides obtectus TaxID=200917 RepID=A0A9P0PPF8_ACAOB|nr:unnamed protein product [Acanthoscelides obtectus]CAK1648284.1 hypothetical protein AOBTE_LOCUS15646 [Acanthoscelides obtectus]
MSSSILTIVILQTKEANDLPKNGSCIQALESMFEGANHTEISEFAYCD